MPLERAAPISTIAAARKISAGYTTTLPPNSSSKRPVTGRLMIEVKAKPKKNTDPAQKSDSDCE